MILQFRTYDGSDTYAARVLKRNKRIGEVGEAIMRSEVEMVKKEMKLLYGLKGVGQKADMARKKKREGSTSRYRGKAGGRVRVESRKEGKGGGVVDLRGDAYSRESLWSSHAKLTSVS